MAMSTGRKIALGLAVVLLLFLLIVPFVLGSMYRETVEKKISESVGAPAKLGGLSISILSMGATLSDLQIGEASALTGGKPIVSIPTLHATVSWATLQGTEMRVKSLTIDDADIQVACDTQGASTLEAFLAGMPKGKRETPMYVDSMRIRDGKLTMHTPKALTAPNSEYTPEPVTVTLGYLGVDGIALPAPGKALPQPATFVVELEELAIRSPLSPAKPAEHPEAAGAPLEEGIELAGAKAKLAVPASLEEPMRIQGAHLHGLKIRDRLLGPNDPDTLMRIQTSRAACLRAPAGESGQPGMQLGNGGVVVEDFKLDTSAIQLDGPNADGNLAWHRFSDFKIDMTRIGFGPGSEAKAENPGALGIYSPSKSSEGDGKLLVEWKNVTGSWPTLSFDQKFELTGVPLGPFHSRVEKSAKLGVRKGTMSTEFAGPTTNGNLKWDGSITISKDTELTGEGISATIKKAIAKAATGEPMRTFRIRGTLLNPEPQPPDMIAGIVFEVFKDAIAGAATGILDTFGQGMGAAVDQGVREGEKLIKKIPGIGGLFGKEEEEK